MSTPTPNRVRPDWEAIERDYRTGRFTLRELQAKHLANNATIARRAAREGWTKDLSEAVRKATNASLMEQVLQREGSAAQQNAATAVLAAAEVNKQVILGHRNDIRTATRLVASLLGELQAAALLEEDAATLVRILAGSDAEPADEAKARAAVTKAIGLGSRISGVRSLADAMAKLQALERQAFNIDAGKDVGDEDPLVAMLKGHKPRSLDVVAELSDEMP